MSEHTGPGPDHNEPAAENPYQQLAADSDIDRAVLEVWGPPAQEYLNELAKDHPEWSQEDLLRHFEAQGVNPQTDPNRENNVREIGQIMDLVEADRPGEPVRVLEIGCSRGSETYSLAVNALVSGHENFHITATDVNPESLEFARRGEYDLDNTVGNLNSREGYPTSGFRREDVQEGYYQETGRTRGVRKVPFVEPSAEVRSHIEFARHDIIDGSVDGEFDLVVVNNVLAHFAPETREKALANALKSLRPGGLLTLEPDMHLVSTDAGYRTGYAEFRSELSDDPRLEPAKIADDHWDIMWRSLYRKRDEN